MSRIISRIQAKRAGTRPNESQCSPQTSEGGAASDRQSYIDLSIKFIGASGLPKMDVVGSADPYFIASVDGKASYTSTVQPNTLKPVWNETWSLKQVPTNATLKVEVLDKDDGSPVDDYIGSFTLPITAGTQEVEIISSLRKLVKGVLWLEMFVTPPSNPHGRPYTFDGPIRYSRHTSPTVGQLTQINDERMYSTWKMYLRAVPQFFPDVGQHWNRDYKAAQSIFQGPTSLAVRSGIRAAHRLLYARSTTNQFGFIRSPEDVVLLFHGGVRNSKKRVKPAVYTYVLSQKDDSFRFSETGAAFFVDFASKHALHSNCAEYVRYSGEFHIRPACGWDKFSDDIEDKDVKWELVMDNNSGTYSPDKELLPNLKGLVEYNFPEFNVVVHDFKDPELERSREACREYAMKYRGVNRTELQPTAAQGEVTLMQQAQANGGKCGSGESDSSFMN